MISLVPFKYIVKGDWQKQSVVVELNVNVVGQDILNGYSQLFRFKSMNVRAFADGKEVSVAYTASSAIDRYPMCRQLGIQGVWKNIKLLNGKDIKSHVGGMTHCQYVINEDDTYCLNNTLNFMMSDSFKLFRNAYDSYQILTQLEKFQYGNFSSYVESCGIKSYSSYPSILLFPVCFDGDMYKVDYVRDVHKCRDVLTLAQFLANACRDKLPNVSSAVAHSLAVYNSTRNDNVFMKYNFDAQRTVFPIVIIEQKSVMVIPFPVLTYIMEFYNYMYGAARSFSTVDPTQQKSTIAMLYIDCDTNPTQIQIDGELEFLHTTELDKMMMPYENDLQIEDMHLLQYEILMKRMVMNFHNTGHQLLSPQDYVSFIKT